MRTLDGRTLLTYSVIVIVGLALLFLVLPNYVPLTFLGIIMTLIPIIVLVAVAYYLLGSSKPSVKPLRPQIQRLLAGVAAVSIAFSVLVTYISTKQPAYAASTLRYVFENTGVALLFAAFACTLVLINLQKFVYWPFWNAKDRRASDERQQTVRNRVYEKSYRVLIFTLIVLGFLSGNQSQRLHDELFQVAALCILGVPAIIAARQKDS